MPRKRGERGAGLGVPQARGVVPGCGDDARAVRAERRGQHPIRMPRERGDRRAGPAVPQACGVVVGCGDDARTVRT